MDPPANRQRRFRSRRLTETGIAEQLGASPIPVREAIRKLVATGILESAVHKGAWVRKVEVSVLHTWRRSSAGAIRTVRNPGDAGSMPATVARRS